MTHVQKNFKKKKVISFQTKKNSMSDIQMKNSIFFLSYQQR